MIFHCIIFSICSTLDSLGIGITYGLKNTHILFSAKIILFICSFFITLLSILLGNTLCYLFPSNIADIIGCFVLMVIGIFMIFSSFRNEKSYTNIKKKENDNLKVYQFFIKFLGITIKIIRNPNNSDFDNSNKIDSKEAIFLGIALSLDSIGIGISSSMFETNFLFLPLCVSLLQLFFLSFGNILGRKIKNISHIPENIWSIFAGFLLIFIGFAKFLF